MWVLRLVGCVLLTNVCDSCVQCCYGGCVRPCIWSWWFVVYSSIRCLVLLFMVLVGTVEIVWMVCAVALGVPLVFDVVIGLALGFVIGVALDK